MNKWLNKLLNRPTTPPNATDTTTPAIVPPAMAKRTKHQLGFGTECTPAIGQKKTPQPLEVLQKFSPIKQLSSSALTALPHKTLRFNPGSIIFLQGTAADAIYYLLKGNLDLHPDAEDNFDLNVTAPKSTPLSYEISAETPMANLPLCSGKVFGATAIAKSVVDILVVAGDVSQLWTKQNQAHHEHLELIDLKLPHNLNDNKFFINFAHAYHKQKFQLPTLPNVALKLRQAMNRDISIRDAVDIIQIDPAIVTKLIQVANSPFYLPVHQVKNCQEAVTRLGLDAARNLVMSINLKQMFQSKNKFIFAQMQQAWKRSVQVSSLCFVLAEETDHINPDEALLAGLINDIGVIPLLHFAEQEITNKAELDEVLATIPHLRAPVGRMVLSSLGFSDELAEIPFEAENWFYDATPDLQLIDIVILAKLHSYLGTEKAKELPYINTIPAYAKLKNGQLSPDFSLAILNKAQQRIQATMSILA